jgi:hypothetical protein
LTDIIVLADLYDQSRAAEPQPVRKTMTSHSTDAAPRCRLLEIPPELRLTIYELIFSSDHGVRLTCDEHILRRRKGNEKRAAILSACRTTYREGRSVFYACMRFKVDVLATAAAYEDYVSPRLKAAEAVQRSLLENVRTLKNVRVVSIDFYLAHHKRKDLEVLGDKVGHAIELVSRLHLRQLHIKVTVSANVHQAAFDQLVASLCLLRCTGAITGMISYSGDGYRIGSRRLVYPVTTGFQKLIHARGG